MHIHVLEHVSFEGPGSIADWARQRGHVLATTRLFDAAPLPQPGSIDGLIVMGGPMSVGDEERFPWLAVEKKFLADFIDRGKPVLGICLGSQLLAEVLGAPVYPNRFREIGWFPVWLTDEALKSPFFAGCPRRLSVFHWHGDTFDLPRGARLLASSEACRNQAFLYGDDILGLQFHLEVTPRSIDLLAQSGASELTGGKYVQQASQLPGQPSEIEAVNAVMANLLDRLFAG